MLSVVNSKTSKQYVRSWFVDVIFMTIIIGVFYAIWIGSHALFTPDEGRYSEVAREMIVTNDFVTPRLNGIPFLDKPVLYYWLQASAIMIFGLKEWALRFWPAAFGVMGCVGTYLAGRMLFSRRTGILSAAILATSPLYYGAAHYANLDLEVAVLISLSLFSLICGLSPRSGNINNRLIILSYVFAAMAFLAKGLIGLFFPAAVLSLWILLLNRWQVLTKIHLLPGLLLFAAIATPWYFLVNKANPQFFQFFFIDQQVSRFLTKGAFNNRTAEWFYVPIVLVGLFPWAVFMLQAIAKLCGSLRKNWQKNAVELFLLLWVAVVFTFFSIPKSKTVGYILPIFPPLALITGIYLDKICNSLNPQNGKLGFIGYLIIAPLISVALLIAPMIKRLEVAPGLAFYLNLAAALFILSSISIALMSYRNDSPIKKLYALLITAIIFLLILIASTGTINQKSIKPLALEIKSRLKQDDEVVTYFKYYQDLPIYLERRITIVADWLAPDIAQNDNWLREMWYGMSYQDTSQWLINETTFWQKWNSDKRLFVMLNKNYLDDFNSKNKGSFHIIADKNDAMLVSNQA